MDPFYPFLTTSRKSFHHLGSSIRFRDTLQQRLDQNLHGDVPDPSCRLGTASRYNVWSWIVPFKFSYRGSAFSWHLSPTALQQNMKTSSRCKDISIAKQKKTDTFLFHTIPCGFGWFEDKVFANFSSGIAKCLNFYVPWVYRGPCWIPSLNHHNGSYMILSCRSTIICLKYRETSVKRNNFASPPAHHFSNVSTFCWFEFAVFLEQPAKNDWCRLPPFI